MFPACLNGCIAALNQAGIAQKEAPIAAMTIFVTDIEGDNAEMTLENSQSSKRIELVASNRAELIHFKAKGDDLISEMPSLLLQPTFETLIKKAAAEI